MSMPLALTSITAHTETLHEMTLFTDRKSQLFLTPLTKP